MTATDEKSRVALKYVGEYGEDLPSQAARDAILHLLENWESCAVSGEEVSEFARSDVPEFLGHVGILLEGVLAIYGADWRPDDYAPLAMDPGGVPLDRLMAFVRRARK